MRFQKLTIKKYEKVFEMYKRHRKLRNNSAIRNLVKDVYIEKSDLIYPIFIEEGENIKNEISSMPGIFRYSIDRIDEELKELVKLGINSILLFGIPKHKDEYATESYNENGIIQKAIRYIKKKYPNFMMDGRVEKISRILAENNFSNIPIMSYSVKYSSSFYGPFRDAADSAPKFGDRKSYQMDFRYVGDAMSEVRSDLEQGADMVIVKPALAYLDILSKVKETFDVPVIAYSVSGEYSMVKAAAINGWINEKNIVMEQMYAFKRAGANAVITYFAKNIARYLDEEVSVINI